MKKLMAAGAALSCLLLGCGGSSSGNSSNSGIPAIVDGIWTGTISTSSQTLTGKALILPNNQFSFMSDDLTVTVNGLVSTTDTALSLSSATLTQTSLANNAYVSNTFGFSYAKVPITEKGNAFSGAFSSFSLNPNGDSWLSGTLALTYATPLNAGVTLANLAGTYTSTATSLGQPLTLQISAAGQVTDPSNTYTVTLSQVAADVNEFTVTVSLKNAPGDPVSGYAFYIPAVTTGESPQRATLWIQGSLFNAQLQVLQLAI